MGRFGLVYAFSVINQHRDGEPVHGQKSLISQAGTPAKSAGR